MNIENKTTAAENTKLHLTEDQISKIIADKKNSKVSQIILSKSELAKTGGFILPLLAAPAPLILKGLATGASSYLGSNAIQKVTGKSGSGSCFPEYDYQGTGTSSSRSGAKFKKKQKIKEKA